ELHRLRRLVEQEESTERPRAATNGIIGESPTLRDVNARIALVAKRDVAICVLGESGTGKELVARAIHVHSSRKHKPFTPVNCAADVRIVSATNRKLESAVDEGRFREDLYYRIRGVEIALPPLRERGNDITLLASHFLAKERERHRSGPSRLSPDAESLFLAYPWPGNV